MDFMNYNLDGNISIVQSEKGNFITLNLKDFLGIDSGKIDIEIYSNITMKHSIFSINFSESTSQLPFIMYSINENETLFIKLCIKLKSNKNATFFTFYDVNKSLFKENITISIEEKELEALSVLTLDDNTSDINYLADTPNDSDNEETVNIPVYSEIPSYADIFYRPGGHNYNKLNVTNIEELTEIPIGVDMSTSRDGDDEDSRGVVRSVNTWRHGLPVSTESEAENDIVNTEVANEEADSKKKEDKKEEEVGEIEFDCFVITSEKEDSDDDNAVNEANKYGIYNENDDSSCTDSDDE